jgi:hypothetical protein
MAVSDCGSPSCTIDLSSLGVRPTPDGSEGLAGPRPSIRGRDLKEPATVTSTTSAISAPATRLDNVSGNGIGLIPAQAQVQQPGSLQRQVFASVSSGHYEHCVWVDELTSNQNLRSQTQS